jgi:2-polyprenyl-3-methyl-5-hydroxy-6-metoxy-1,4-benzoquinol methylase
MYASEEKFRIVKCHSCGLVFMNPMPDPEELKKYYPLEYYESYGMAKRELKFLQRSKVQKVIRLKKKGSILDIGCQKGEFLKRMEEKGWKVFGVDISVSSCNYARKKLGLKNIYAGDVLDFDFPERYFDVVTMWQVIEHLRDPLATLRKINRLLKRDGVLIFECPNFGSFTSRVFKDKWPGLDVPRHLYQFTPPVIRAMAEKAGFRVERIDHFAQPLMNLVCLKVSIFRQLGIEKRTAVSPAAVSATPGPKNRSIVWIAARGLNTFFCFLVSLFFAMCRKADIIGVYCKLRTK